MPAADRRTRHLPHSAYGGGRSEVLVRLAVAVLAVSLGGNADARWQRPLERHEYSQVHMGLLVRVVVYAPGEAAAARSAASAFARIAALDAMMSDYREDSELRRLQPMTRTEVSPELFDVLARAVAIARATDGAFDPTLGPLTRLWREARRTRRLPDPEVVKAARGRTGWQYVELNRQDRTVRLNRPGMQLDLGGIAKGWILEDARRVLFQEGLRRVLVESGGDLIVGDAPSDAQGWRIETPGADAAFSRRASALVRAALATSGPSAQFVEIDGVRYSHVLDPRTGLGLTNHVLANVIAADGATADALATALTVAGATRARELASRFRDVMISVRIDQDADRGLRFPSWSAPSSLPR